MSATAQLGLAYRGSDNEGTRTGREVRVRQCSVSQELVQIAFMRDGSQRIVVIKRILFRSAMLSEPFEKVDIGAASCSTHQTALLGRVVLLDFPVDQRLAETGRRGFGTTWRLHGQYELRVCPLAGRRASLTISPECWLDRGSSR